MKPYHHTVQYYETDKMGITHHSNYIRWMEEARVAMLEEMGWGYDRLESLGVGSPVIGLHCEYKHPTIFRDEVEITAEVLEYQGAHLVVSYQMRQCSDGETVLTGTSRHCFVGTDGKLLRLRRVLPAFDEALRAMVQPFPSPGTVQE